METNRRRAFITGITGQDGSYLTEFLLERDYEVHGLVRRTSGSNLQRIQHLLEDRNTSSRLFLHTGNMTDGDRLSTLVREIRPDEVYNLAAQSQVGKSFDVPVYTANVNGLGVLRLLEVVRSARPDVRFFQASTSEMYGCCEDEVLTLESPFEPVSPYGIAKLMGHRAAVSYREGYDMFVCSGIMFNHESPRRSESFVTRKIARGAAEIKKGNKDTLWLGNINARRDWGYAPEYVEAMWNMMQSDRPGDYVIATGKTHSVREFAERAFQAAGYEISWEGEKEEEIGRDDTSGEVLIRVSPELYRPLDIPVLKGSPRKAKEKLDWEPRTSFDQLVQIMVDSEF